jgi:hypothetical protein
MKQVHQGADLRERLLDLVRRRPCRDVNATRSAGGVDRPRTRAESQEVGDAEHAEQQALISGEGVSGILERYEGRLVDGEPSTEIGDFGGARGLQVSADSWSARWSEPWTRSAAEAPRIRIVTWRRRGTIS